jgi:hypothetical protein
MRLPRRAVPLIEGLLDQQLDLINRLRPVTPD